MCQKSTWLFKCTCNPHGPHVAMVCHLSFDTMCEVLFWKLMTHSFMQCIVVHPCVTHLLDIFYLKLQRFIISGIMRIDCCCHLALFYLWQQCTMGFCNLFWNNICEFCIGWTMIDGCNFRQIVASNALWCAHASPIYWTFFHLKLQRFTFSGILWIIYCCHLALFICGTTTCWGFATSFTTPCVKFGLDGQWLIVLTFI